VTEIQRSTRSTKTRRIAAYSWLVLGYNLAVIVWGGYVRASGAGAGCGSHWPLCNGEAIPHGAQIATLIEFTHRFTSGLALILILGLAAFTIRTYSFKHPVTLGACLALLFIFTEALVGAGLVLFELVAHNASIARALFMSVHLTNTFLLLAALTLTAWWASSGRWPLLKGQRRWLWLFAGALFAALVLGVSGAVAALGDTLFPSISLAQGVRQDLSGTAHFLIRLRLLHPLIAIATSCYLLATAAAASFVRPEPWVRRFSLLLALCVLAQLGLGLLNVILLAPIWLQLVHLLWADLVWITLVLLTSATLGSPQTQETKLTEIRLHPALET
jgi:heme A synthase